jgi:hypothetical protein
MKITANLRVLSRILFLSTLSFACTPGNAQDDGVDHNPAYANTYDEPVVCRNVRPNGTWRKCTIDEYCDAKDTFRYYKTAVPNKDPQTGYHCATRKNAGQSCERGAVKSGSLAYGVAHQDPLGQAKIENNAQLQANCKKGLICNKDNVCQNQPAPPAGNSPPQIGHAVAPAAAVGKTVVQTGAQVGKTVTQTAGQAGTTAAQTVTQTAGQAANTATQTVDAATACANKSNGSQTCLLVGSKCKVVGSIPPRDCN